MNSEPNPLLIAHRGIAAHYPENTRAAFAAAIDCGADAIECDVQLTADHQLVVCHDQALDRYDHSGVVIKKTHLQELKNLDIGTWFCESFHAERFLTLPMLLADFAPRIPIFLELKTEDATDDQVAVIVAKVVSDIRKSLLAVDLQQLRILCFDAAVLHQIHRLLPEIRLVWNSCTPQQITDDDILRRSWLSAIDGRIAEMSLTAITRFKNHGLDVFSFTCNSSREIERAMTLQLDGLITDDVVAAREVIATLRQAET